MEKTKIYTILGSLTKSEFNSFRVFLQSPYFNKSNNVLKLFNILYPHYPEFNSRVLNKDMLHSKVFPESRYSSRSVDNLFTRLRKLCENYISINGFRKNRQNTELELAKYYKSKKLESLMVSKAKVLIAEFNQKAVYTSDQSYYYHFLHSLITDYHLNHTHTEKHAEILDELSTNYGLLRNFSFSHKIKLLVRTATVIYSANITIPSDSAINVLFKDIITAPEFDSHPAVNILSKIAESIINKTKFDYFALKSELLSIKDRITKEDFDHILIILVFYFFPIIDETDHKLVEERFKHIRLMIERKLWNTIPANIKEKNFSFAVNSAIKAGDIEWAENFIKYYSIYVVKEQRNDAINYNMAILLYYKAGMDKFKNEDLYRKAFEYLSHFRIQDYSNKLHVYLLRTMLYFDTGEFDGVYSESKAFEQFLTNNKDKINAIIAENYSIFNRYMKLITNYTIDGNKPALLKLADKIGCEKAFVNKAWLLERISNQNNKK